MKFVAVLTAAALYFSSASALAIEGRAGGKTCDQYRTEIGTYDTATARNEACVVLVRLVPNAN